MIRFLVNLAVYMAAAALALFIADMVLDGVAISYPVAFLWVVILFGLIQAIIEPLFQSITEKNAETLTGAVGLISALVALFLTSLISDGLSVDGLGNWIAAALIIWLASMIAGVILRATVAKRFIQQVRD